MPVAPSLPALFDFESPFEDALQSHFANLSIGNVPAFVQVLTPRTPKDQADELKTPRMQIRAGITAIPAAGNGLQENDMPAGAYLSYFALGLTLDVVTSRSNAEQPHGLLRGAARVAMLDASGVLNSANIPFLLTVLVTPQSSTQAVDSANDEILTQLGYVVEFWIPPENFPP